MTTMAGSDSEMAVSYAVEPGLPAEEFIDVLRRSTLAAPKARSYYPHIGTTPHDSCWTIARKV